MRRVLTARLALWPLVAMACAYEPLPLAAQAGTTVLLPLTGEWLDGEFIGYESELTRHSGVYDDQRGSLVFTLRDAADPEQAEHELTNRWVTRAYPDPASRLGMQNGALGGEMSQVLAVVDVPAAVPAGHYVIGVGRRRRVAGGGPPETLPAGGPGLRHIEVLPAEVDPASGEPIEKFSSALPLVGGSPTSGLLGLYPHPKLVLAFGWPPAAARVVLGYPPSKLSILAVVEDLHSSSGSIVTWHDSDPPGELTIDLVDPGRSTRALGVVFELVAPLTVGRATPSDFVVLDARLYGDDGEPLPLSVTPSVIR